MIDAEMTVEVVAVSRDALKHRDVTVALTPPPLANLALTIDAEAVAARNSVDEDLITVRTMEVVALVTRPPLSPPTLLQLARNRQLLWHLNRKNQRKRLQTIDVRSMARVDESTQIKSAMCS